MRIGFVTQWFPPEPGTFVAASIADGLAERGHIVDVLTGFPNYPTGRLHPEYPLERYRRDQRSARVIVHRAPLYPSHDTSGARRMANYLSYGLSASWVARTRLVRPDVWLTYSSPATAALPAMTVPRHLRAPSCLLLQDLWPDSVSDSGMVRGLVARGVEQAMHKFCRWTYRRSAGIGVISPSMRRILIERGVPPDRIYWMPNWVDDTYLRPNRMATDDLRRSLGLPTGRLFMYTGNMGELQCLSPLVEAFGLCADVNLALVGNGVYRERLQRLVTDKNLRNIRFIETQPADRIGEYLAASDVQIVSLRDTRLLRATMPSKIQMSMAASRPILAHAAGDAAEVITHSRSGLTVHPGDIIGITKAIRALSRLAPESLQEMGRNSRLYYERHFCPKVGLDRMEHILTICLNSERKH